MDSVPESTEGDTLELCTRLFRMMTGFVSMAIHPYFIARIMVHIKGILVQGIFSSAHHFLLYIEFLVLDLLLGIVQCTSIPHASTVRHLCVVRHVWQHVPQQLAQHVSCREDTTTGAVLSPVDTSARLLNAPVSIQDKIKYEGEWLQLKLGKSLDITPTSLLHQRGVTGGWGAGLY